MVDVDDRFSRWHHGGIKNAHLDPGLLVRVGIPEKSGKLPAHAFNQEYATMVSANAFWNAAKGQFVVPQASDLYMTDFALDSAGYSAMALWAKKGAQAGMANIYPWSYSAYLELASVLAPSWYSAPDLCVERQIARNDDEVNYRIDATATLLEGCLRMLYAWSNELAKTCPESVVRQLVRIPVPVIQGFDHSHYRRSLELTLEVWERWRPWLDAPALIGVGSVCRREVSDPEHGLLAVLNAVCRELPDGVRLHGFGVKGTALDHIKMIEQVASVDSMAFDFGARFKAFRSGVPNSAALRTSEMTAWMSSALARVAPKGGDQFRLF